MGLQHEGLTRRVIGAAITVHRELGPGLLESAYEACLVQELNQQGMSVARQVPLSVVYKGLPVDCGFRIDLVVDETVVVEIKSVETLDRIHEAQLITYLKLSRLRIGLLINFNSVLLRDGIVRRIL